jgi:hypothetical protein
MTRCTNCDEKLNETTQICPECGDVTLDDDTPITVPKQPLLKILPGVIGVSFVALFMTLGVWSFLAWVKTSDTPLVEVRLGETHVGTIGPETPMGAAQKPFIDYSLRVPMTGQYLISLSTDSSDQYDPYISLLRDGNIIASDNDSGVGNNALITANLRPGEYTVRVTNYELGRLENELAYELLVSPTGRMADLLEGSATPEG